MDHDLRRAFDTAPVARLATVDSRLQPNLVPVCFAVRDASVYSAIDGKPKRSQRLKRLENIRAHPDVSVLVDHYEDDWSCLWWIAAEGTAEILDGGDESELAIDLLSEKYPQYCEAPPTGAVIAIRVRRWRAWSAKNGSATRTEEPEER